MAKNQCGWWLLWSLKFLQLTCIHVTDSISRPELPTVPSSRLYHLAQSLQARVERRLKARSVPSSGPVYVRGIDTDISGAHQKFPRPRARCIYRLNLYRFSESLADGYPNQFARYLRHTACSHLSTLQSSVDHGKVSEVGLNEPRLQSGCD